MKRKMDMKEAIGLIVFGFVVCCAVIASAVIANALFTVLANHGITAPEFVRAFVLFLIFGGVLYGFMEVYLML